MANANLTLSVESVVHDVMRKVAQNILDQHGICVHDIRFRWIDVTTSEKSGKILTEVDVHITTDA